MPDLIEYVETNRGLLKKIELSIPGYRGYRIREDIRIADNLLRSYLADQMEMRSQKKLERVRELLSKSLELDLLNDIGELIFINKGLIAKFRHAEHGYSGISPQYRIEESELNQIYDFDNTLIESTRTLQSKIDVLLNRVTGNDLGEIRKLYLDIKSEMLMLDETFKRRQSQFIESIINNPGA